MRASTTSSCTLALAAAITLLSGCTSGGLQSSSSPGSAMPQQSLGQSNARAQVAGQTNTLAAMHGIAAGKVNPDHSKSHMIPGAQDAPALLYVSDSGTNDVNVYKLLDGTQVGTLTGFSEPQGECADKAHNVWITNTATSTIIEFAHGGTTPIATLSDTGQFPVGCSVNMANGDLAVSNIVTTGSGAGSVSVYAGAMGTPTIYSDPNLARVYFLAYDNHGNLFVDGLNGSGGFQLAELPSGSSTFTDITLNQSIAFPGGVSFHEGEVVVGDQSAPVVYRVSDNTSGTIIGTTPLAGTTDVVQFTVACGPSFARVCGHSKLFAPDAASADVKIFNYPKGGTPKTASTITGLTLPIGTAVSQ
jgi:hypothetical protein